MRNELHLLKDLKEMTLRIRDCAATHVQGHPIVQQHLQTCREVLESIVDEF